MVRIRLRKESKKKKSNLPKKIIRKKIRKKTTSKGNKIGIKKVKKTKRKKPVTYRIFYKNIEVKGTFEYRACEILDQMIEEGSLTSWEYEKIRIPYLGKDMRKHHYIVDFILNENGKKRLLEVKGRETPLDRIKWAATRKYGWDLTIWKKNDIFVDINYKDYLNKLKISNKLLKTE